MRQTGNGAKMKMHASIYLGVYLAAIAVIAVACAEKPHNLPGSLYYCPMHPSITSDKAGRCPICGMDLVLKNTAKNDMHGLSDNSQQALKIDHAQQSMLGLTTSQATLRALSYEIRSSARVAFDPELYAAQEEYRLAKEINSEALLRAAATRLKILGLSAEQIDRVHRPGALNHEQLLLPAEKTWIYADVYESELNVLRPQQRVLVSSASIPNRTFEGKLLSVSPVVNPKTRTVTVRSEVNDAQGLLKPNMFVDVRIRIELGESVAVPQDAVFFSGERALLFVRNTDETFSARVVKLGQEAEGFYQILEGVSAGEEVVTSANFFLDSESRLQRLINSSAEAAPAHQHQP